MALTWKRARRAVLAATVGCLVFAGQAVAAPGGNLWLSAGGDRGNTRSQSSESKISPATVGDLTVTWELTTGGDVSATPAVDAKRVYVPDWAGNLYAVDRKTGAVEWRISVPDVTGIPGDKARATPAVADGKLVFGTQGGVDGGGGKVMAVDRDTGELIWSTQVDSHPAAVITQSATVFDGVVYVGVSSMEELVAAVIPNYDCCTFRGSMNALDLDTGEVLWTTHTAPEGYSGAAVWGSSPAIDVKRGSVYIATGNNYSVPAGVLACVAAAGDDAAARACLPADDFFDSVIALDRTTGAVKWATSAVPYDAWTADCLPSLGTGANCPSPAGPGYDFAQAPALFTLRSHQAPLRELVGAGSKSGEYWALDPDTGHVVWVTNTGPGGTAGGLQWGSAVDGDRVYTANANSDGLPWLFPDGTEGSSGFWSGLDAVTGQILWQTEPTHGGSTSGPVTTANGVVFGCSLDSSGYMYALDAATGEVLWDHASGGSCLSGAAISKGSVYWGSGYSNLGYGTANDKLYAFGLG